MPSSHWCLVRGRDDTYCDAAPAAKDASELHQPESRIRKELQAKLAYDGIETTVSERQCLAVSGYRPKRRVVQPVARTFEHRGRDVCPNHETRSADDWECHQRGLARSSRDIEHSAPRRYL